MRINNRSYPQTQFMWNLIFKLVEDNLPFVRIVVENNDVPLTKMGMKTTIVFDEYSKLENPLDFYQSKIEKMVVRLLITKLISVFESLPSRTPHSGETFEVLPLKDISKKLEDKKLIYSGTPLHLTIDGINTYVTLEDFDEESGEYSTAVFLTGDFLIPPSEKDNIHLLG